MDFLDADNAHWAWLTLGLVLGVLEMLVPGVYLIWLALAAIATGVLTALFDLSLAAQIVDFAFLSLISVFSAKRFLRDSPIASADPLMNRKGERLVGEIATVVQPIEHGSGRVHLGDSEWIARGVDLGVGERVRVTGTDGAVLLVAPLNVVEAIARDESTTPE